MAIDSSRETIQVASIEKGGSGRKFWRMHVGGVSLILVRYGEDRPENRHYVAIAQFLAGVGVRVPAVHFHDAGEGLIIMEDAGDTDLWSFRNAPWRERRALYQRTLDEALTLHLHAHLAPSADRITTQPVFDEALYRWEQDYFFEHCLGRHFGITERVDHAPVHELAAELASLPRCFVHRDFQSQNIIVREGEVCLIDFQGLRPGLAQYDLASLLLDPYVTLTKDEHDELLGHYVSGLLGPGQEPDAAFERVYHLCAMQRLMQALGAYGKLGHLDGRTEFLEHIPVATKRLRDVLGKIKGLEPLIRIVPKP
jgi:aminoglycoside/choline kinase family phosphotransferase